MGIIRKDWAKIRLKLVRKNTKLKTERNCTFVS